MATKHSYVRNVWRRLSVALLAVVFCCTLSACEIHTPEDEAISQRTQIVLMDWHVAGFWVINSPVAWVRVYNYNQVPIKDITFQYNTFDEEGHPLNQGTFTIEGTVPPMTSKNFIELYLGLVDLPSQRLSIKILSARRA